jgi:predicted AlkP superfamily phosphohydrolase/phosphomutase
VRETGALVALTLAAGLVSCAGEVAPPSAKRVIVLGIDGMDPDLTGKLMSEGRLPNFSRLAAMGSFQPLGTSVPPLSPVAWSDFITGLDSGGHGIFDFIHRDPETMIPYLSTSRAIGSEESFEVGKWKIPISGGSVELLRRGEPFWAALEQHGVETTIVRMPANYPPSGQATRELSGMGTPDVLGNYGTFSFYTSVPFAFSGRNLAGGEVYPVDVIDGVVEAKLHGPPNPFLAESEAITAPFTVSVDDEKPVALLEIGGQERVLKVGEWTDWLAIDLEMIPTQTIGIQARFYLRSVAPDFEMYVTPLNLDPYRPAQPISNPESYAAELAAATGRYYTQGMPEDTHGLKQEVLTRDEFLSQARITGQEIIDQYRYVLREFEHGLLFYYFGNADLVSHMMWRPMDPEHPLYDPEKDLPYAQVISSIYVQLDAVVGDTLDTLGPDDTLVVMSDHGFTSWRRRFNLNGWLRDEGYLTPLDRSGRNDPGFLTNVDFPRTRAYAIGLNGLYLNVRGRERQGTVSPSERKALVDEIADKLLAVVDPATGQNAITKVYKSEEYYEDAGELAIGPDLIVGYAKRTGSSDESAGGTVAGEVFSDNPMQWSGDHRMDHETVPGVLFTSRPLKRPVTRLKDLAAALLAEFGVEGFPPPRQETGRETKGH